MFSKSEPVELVLREYHLEETFRVAHDRLVRVDEMVDYEPPKNIASYVFIGMKKGSVKNGLFTDGRTLSGEVVQEGFTIHVGEVIPPNQLLERVSEEEARVCLSALRYDFAQGTCQYSNGSLGTVYEGEQVYNPQTKVFTLMDAALSR